MPHLAAFDPSAQFKAARSFRANGDIILRDALIDKAAFSDVLLRRLYENHRIVALTEDEIEALAAQAAEDAAKREAAGKPPLDPAAGADKPTGGAPMQQGVVTPNPALASTSDQDQASIAQLIDQHTKAELLALAQGIEGVKADNNKAEIAAKIVAARKDSAQSADATQLDAQGGDQD